jgi:hypothetical protein
MVKINVKQDEKTEFWLETQTSVEISTLARDINIVLKNKQLLLQLVGAAEALLETASATQESADQVNKLTYMSCCYTDRIFCGDNFLWGFTHVCFYLGH